MLLLHTVIVMLSLINNLKKMKQMRNIIIALSTVLFSTFSFAQVAIGKVGVTNSSVSLEFGDYVAGQGKGIVLPWVTSAASVTGAEKGTVIYDTNDKIIKYRKADGSWFNLSKNEMATVGGTPNYDTTGVVNTSLQDTYLGQATVERTDAKVGIGTSITSTPGILVLEDSNKAMILPKVSSPHLNIKNPEPGTMVYDTVSKQLAVYNGKVWSFWKP